MGNKHKKNIIGTTTIIVFMVLFFYYYELFSTVLRNGDNATILLQGKAMLEGNFFLKGWDVPPDSFWSIDIVINAIALMIFGFNANIMFIVPAFIYSSIIISCFFLIGGKQRISESWPKYLLVFIILGFPSGVMLNLVSRTPIHLGAFLYFLVCLILLTNFKGNKLINALIVFILFLTASGDPYAIYIFILPMLIIYVDQYWREKDKDSLFNIIKMILIIGFSKLSIKLINHFGGFYAHEEVSIFVSLEKFPHNLYLTVYGILELFKANFFGLPLSPSKLFFPFIGVCVLLLVLLSVYTTLKKWKTTDILSRILAISIIINIFAYLFSTQAIDLSTTRFLFPIIIFGSILSVRNTYYKQNWIKVLIILIIIAESVGIYQQLKLPKVTSPTAAVEQWLLQNDYKYGYAPFWSASIATVYTNEHIKVRPIRFDGVKYVQMNWLSDRDWYGSEQGNFIILDEQDISTVNIETAIRNFGEPNQVVDIGAYKILIWDKDITPLISRE